jgi:hypothetical protein
MKSTQEALAKPPGSKMYAFGTVALHQFVGNIHLWPQFCARVLQVRRKVVVVSGRRQYLEMENDTYCGFMTERTAGEEEITLLGWIRTVYDIKDRTLDKFLASCTVYTPG